MKIAFDENVPLGMVRTFQVLSKERQLKRSIGTLEVESAADYAPRAGDRDHEKGSDVPWLKRFSSSGGRAIISGDVAMRNNPHELKALEQLDLVVIFFEKKWSEWDFFKKTALLIYYWPEVAKKLKSAKSGEFWCVPGHWREDGQLRDVSINRSTALTKHSPVAAPKLKSGNKPRASTPSAIVENSRPKRLTGDARQGLLKFDPNE